MEDKMDVAYERLLKELRRARIFSMVSSGFVILLIIGGFLLVTKLQPLFNWMEQTQPVLVELAQLDMDGVNLAIEQLNYTMNSVDWEQVSDAVGSVDWKTVSDSLSKVDVEAINKAVEGLDTKELSDALETLNNAVDALEAMGEKIKSFTSIFTN